MSAIQRADDLKQVAALTFHPGYVLLCEILQARLDDLTDELADPNVSLADTQPKLRYWQAFREIVHTIRTVPQNFAEEVKAIEEHEPIHEDPAHRAMRLAAEQYFQGPNSPFPVE